MTEAIYQTPAPDIFVGDKSVDKAALTELLFSFKGRVNRTVYWIWQVGVLVSMGVFGMLLGLLPEAMSDSALLITGIPVLIAGMWIGLAIQVKRWHDIDCSGWWLLINVVPYVGPIIACIANGFFGGTRVSAPPGGHSSITFG